MNRVSDVHESCMSDYPLFLRSSGLQSEVKDSLQGHTYQQVAG